MILNKTIIFIYNTIRADFIEFGFIINFNEKKKRTQENKDESSIGAVKKIK